MFEYLAVYTRPYFTGRSQHLHNGQSFDDLCTGHPDDTLKERPSLAARTAGSSFAALEADCAFRDPALLSYAGLKRETPDRP